MRGDQRLQIGEKHRVGAAGVGQKCASRRSLNGKGGLKQILDSGPLFGRHGAVGPWSPRIRNALATAQSRFTVAGEIANAAAVSSTLRPANTLSSTIRPC